MTQMTRWLGVAGACMVAGAIVVSAEQARRVPPPGGGSGGTEPARGQGPGRGAEQNPELQQAREALQRDVAEGKRLQEQLKHDKTIGDKVAVKADNEALKLNREQVKKDQERIKQLTSSGRSGRSGRTGGDGRAGGTGRGRGRGGS